MRRRETKPSKQDVKLHEGASVLIREDSCRFVLIRVPLDPELRTRRRETKPTAVWARSVRRALRWRERSQSSPSQRSTVTPPAEGVEDRGGNVRWVWS